MNIYYISLIPVLLIIVVIWEIYFPRRSRCCNNKIDYSYDGKPRCGALNCGRKV